MKKHLWILILILLSACGPNKDLQMTSQVDANDTFRTYSWPPSERPYWPTEEWENAPFEEPYLNEAKMRIADSLALSDNAFRSLLVIKEGVIVFEKYYHEGGVDKSTEVWSVTKSFTSALIGIAIDQGQIKDMNQPMTDYLPAYPGFKNITIKNVLTHQTGLNWDEGNQQAWIQSTDWVGEGLERGFVSVPGSTFLYSSANSHFLSKLLQQATGESVGEFASKNLFEPLGIRFSKIARNTPYKDWQELHIPVPHSWRQDNNGLEIGAFGLHITAREMAKFGFLYLNQGKWEGRQLISKGWIEASTREQVTINEHKGFGLHWVTHRRHGQFCFEADGWGGQMISVIPALDMIVVIKCDEITPRDNYSYRVLELAIEAGLK